MLIFSELMDSRSLFLTANADTVYFWSFHDLSQGPLVFETPSETLGLFNDIWFRWISDFGLPGADRGQGGTYLLVGPEYDGPLPEGGCYVRHSRTNHVTLIGRAFINENPGDDPAPTVDRIKEQLKIYPYAAGGVGSSVGAYLTGKGPLGQPASPQSPPVRGGDRAGDEHRPAQRLRPLRDARRAWCSWSRPRRSIPSWPVSSPRSGSSRARSSRPTLGCGRSSTRRWPSATPRPGPSGWVRHPTEGFRYYDGDTAWWNMLFVGGFEFTNPPPEITPEGVKPYPNKGARRLHSRTSMFYTATAITPAMCMRLTGVGSQYLIANVDAAGEPFDGAKTYRVRLPKDIPAARFWSLNLYDNQTRSLLQTHAALSPGRQPGVPLTRRGGRVRRLHRRVLLAHPARRRRRRQLDPDRPREGLVRHPALLQPAAALLRQDLAGRRVRARELAAGYQPVADSVIAARRARTDDRVPDDRRAT